MRADTTKHPKSPETQQTRIFHEIEKTDGVLGGSARIRGTRLSVWFLVALKRLGQRDEEILLDYPQLLSAQLAEAWDYEKAFPEEIAAEIQENEEI